MFTVGDLLGLAMDYGIPNGYRIYDYAVEENVYDSEIGQDNHDDYLDYDIVSFNITELGVLEININTEEE